MRALTHIVPESLDRYVYPEYRWGNTRERSLGEVVFDPAQVRFGYAKSESLPAYCRECEFLRDCWGECPKSRVLRMRCRKQGGSSRDCAHRAAGGTNA